MSLDMAKKWPRIMRILRIRNLIRVYSRNSRLKFSCSLQVLLSPAINTLKRFVQVLHGVGNAEAQIAFAKFAERRAGKTCHTGFVQHCFRQLFRCPSCLLHVGKSIERAMRQATAEAFDVVQAGDEFIAPRVELLT